MNTLSIPGDQVVISDYLRIVEALPQGEQFMVFGDGPRFQIKIYDILCAGAMVKDGQVVFRFAETGVNASWANRLKNELLKKYPTLNHDRLVWKVFWRAGEVFHCASNLIFETEPEALGELRQLIKVDGQIYLCAFKEKFADQSSFWTDKTFPIYKNHRMGKNLGSMKITLKKA